MRAMANRGFGNGKSTLDNGYGMFLNMLEYKLQDRGKCFIRPILVTEKCNLRRNKEKINRNQVHICR